MNTRKLSPSLAVFCLTLSLSIYSVAQGRPGGGGAGGGGGGRPVANPPTTGRPTMNAPDTVPNPTSRGPMFLSGKVVVDDGIPLTDSVTIQSVCRGQVHTEGYTDSRGTFSLQLGGPMSEGISSAEDNGPGFSTHPGGNPAAGGLPRRDLRDCDLQAVLPGFTSQVVGLASKITDFGNADVGTIVLHRLQHVEGLTISATSAMAPDKAKKLYEKGREDEKKQKLDAAKEKFQKAVEIYPNYAVAWYEMGRIQVQQKDIPAAKASFQSSIKADPKYVSPLDDLATIEVQERLWDDVVRLTDQLLSLNPLSFPEAWLYNGVANYNLHAFDKAEKSARQGLSTDLQHRFPKLEYLLGMVLVQKRDYQGAAAHIRAYLALAPSASDAEAAQKQVAELERLAGAGAPPQKQ
jgi:tetratricopeptide (TPR) repeat protein